jgi:vancomycin resistance protein VanJ
MPLADPAPAHKDTGSTRGLSTLVWLYAVAIVAVAALIQRLSDVWWPATLLLFAPRWIWVLPLLALVPWALWRQRRLLWVLVASAALWLLAVSGFVPPSAAALSGARVQPDLRVLTYNVGGGVLDPGRIGAWLDSLAPDVAVFQECSAAFEAAKPALAQRGWQVDVQYGSCMASRHRIRKVEVRDPKEIHKMGGSGVIVRYEVETPGRVVNIVNLHLETVREGLEAVMHHGLDGAAALDANIDQREIESVLARAFASQAGAPLIVAGDFNMPVESAIYRANWGGFSNAFSCAGWGFGATKATRWHGIRIDHVLLGPGWSCLGAAVGPDLGLDHRPMLADLSWQGTQ